MNDSRKEKEKRYPPSNTASQYFTDPVYNSESIYGFMKDYNEVIESMQETANSEDTTSIDEPVESWGWINDSDNGKFKEKRGY